MLKFIFFEKIVYTCYNVDAKKHNLIIDFILIWHSDKIITWVVNINIFIMMFNNIIIIIII